VIAVNSVVDEVEVPARLDAILRSRSSQRAIAERSYWHPNGFLKLVLEGASGVPQLRLHVWPTAHPGDDIHDHAWAYRSLVLAGALCEARYDVVAGPDADAEDFWRHTYRPAGGGRFQLDAPQPVRLREQETRVLSPGDRATGDEACIHFISAIRFPAVTLLSVGRPVHPHSSVYLTAPVVEQTLEPVRATRREVATWVDFALAAQCST
jgi:hypothetical protein